MLFLGANLQAQQSAKVVKTIKGRVINSSTNKAVSYTNIGLEGTYYGTASDDKGYFELKIPKEFVSKNLFFSTVGFNIKELPVNSLFEKEFNIIKIKPKSYGIDDVDIEARNMVLIRILRMASENIPNNYIHGPYNLIGIYSNEKIAGNDTTKQKSEILFYDYSGYSKPSKKDAYKSVKYSIKKEESDIDYSFSTGTTTLDELLEIDWVRSASSLLNPALTGSINLKLIDEITLLGKEFWVIYFEQTNPTLAASGDFYATSFSGTITINKEDYSVRKIKGKVESKKNNRQGKGLAIGKANNYYFENVNYDFLVEYELLKPAKIELNKLYTFNGETISEHSILEITKTKATNLTELVSRQYFTGE